MKKYIVICLLLFSYSLFSQSAYKYSVNLNKCVDDKLHIVLIAPDIKDSVAIFRMPKIVPGTYEIYDFGRFVSGFKAYDKSNKEIKTQKTDANSWSIPTANKLYRIEYDVEDTWDSENTDGSFVFEPGGSNFEKGKNFMLNTHCLFGYFDKFLKYPFEIKIVKPQQFYGSCSLIDVTITDTADVYRVNNYMDLQDAPMMYCKPDTTVLKVGGAEVVVSLYNENKSTTSKFIADNILEVLNAQKEYLGGSLPIKKYVYLIYLTAKPGKSGSSGALEHSYSSLYFLPEMPETYLVQTIKDVSAHEFFHIVTPLNIHSEEIENFDYNNPKMSKHLWLYEGVTEYAAGLVQVKYGKMSVEEYLNVLQDKIYNSQMFNDTLPFTRMSKGCLDEYKNQYQNVYEKGALIGLCVDVKLRQLSKGKYGIQDLMKDLASTYGKEKAFKDDELFDKIVSITYPEMKDFFDRYVAGNESLPLVEVFNYVGISFGEKVIEKQISFGGFALSLDPKTNKLIVVNTGAMDAFGKAMGYFEDDELYKFNGKKISLKNAQKIFDDFFMKAKVGDELKVEVKRKTNGSSKPKKVVLKSNLFEVEQVMGSKISVKNNASSEQLELRKSWIGKTR